MPPGTVITWFRFSPGVVSTTYAVMTLVTEPIGRSVTDDLDQRSAPVAAFASSARRDRTPTGAAAAFAPPVAAPGAAAAGGGAPPPRHDQARDHRTRGQPAGDPHAHTSRAPERRQAHSLSAAWLWLRVASEFSSERKRAPPGPRA